MLTAGSVVGGYRIERLLGAGGMGAVYLAANPILPRRDAVKVLSPELSRNPDFRARFIREADVAASLEHPQIVSVYSRGETDDGQLWIAMQFVEGTDADRALRAGTMSPGRAVHITGEVAKALDFAHSRNVVHRDVKPENFLLSGPPGPSELALLGDFGIARALDDVGLTATGSVMATVAYAAPEVLSGMQFDGRADIYSLGCTLFRLLTGQTPFSGENGVAAILVAHLQRPPPQVTDLVPSLPPALNHVIATAMAKEPFARFSSASALARAAAAAFRDPTLQLRAPLPPIPSADVASYPQVGSSAGHWWQDPAQRTMSRPPPPSPPRRSRTAIGAAIGATALVAATTIAVTAWPKDTNPQPSSSTNSSMTSAPAPPDASGQALPATDIKPDQLRSILLTPAELPPSGGASMALESDSTGLADDAATVAAADQDCLNAWAPAQQSVYHATRSAPLVVVTGAVVQSLRGANQLPWQDGVVQSAISFDTEKSAGGFYVRQRGSWELCGAKAITVTPPGQPPQTWEFAAPLASRGVYTITATLRGGGATCQHGLLTRGNVDIDIRQCRSSSHPDVEALALETSAKVPHQ